MSETEAEAIPYRVRRSKRARRVRVAVGPRGGVEVVLPPHAGERDAQAAVAELRPWIERRLAQAGRARAAIAARAGTVPYLDETLALRPEAGRTRVHRRGGELLVPAGAADAGDGERLGASAGAALERWYRRRARIEVAARLDRATALAGTPYTTLTIRAQRTRWASCSPAGAMSFNWRLLLAPASVLDYVVWHEVCHLEVRDHSAAFWRLVAARCPGYREQAAWLRRNGATLVL